MILLAVIPFWVQIAIGAGLLLFLFVLKRPAAAKLLIALGGALLAVRARRIDIDADVVWLPNWVYVVLLVSGLILVVVGIIGIIFPFHALIDAIKQFLDTRFGSPRFSCKAAQTSELDEALTFSQSFFGDATTDIDSVKELHQKNPYLFYLVYKLSESGEKKTQKLVGFFDLIPITKSAASLLQQEKLDGPSLSSQHIVKPGGRPAAIYLAGLGANGSRAKAWMLGRLEERLERYRMKGLPIYTRPVTERGLQLAKQNKFTPVNPQSGKNELLRIYKLESFSDRPRRKFRPKARYRKKLNSY